MDEIDYFDYPQDYRKWVKAGKPILNPVVTTDDISISKWLIGVLDD